MLDMAPDVEHSAFVPASLIIRRVNSIRQDAQDALLTAVVGGDRAREPADMYGHGAEQTDFGQHGEGMSALDEFWDFSLLTPSLWNGFM